MTVGHWKATLRHAVGAVDEVQSLQHGSHLFDVVVGTAGRVVRDRVADCYEQVLVQSQVLAKALKSVAHTGLGARIGLANRISVNPLGVGIGIGQID